MGGRRNCKAAYPINQSHGGSWMGFAVFAVAKTEKNTF